MGLDVGVVTIEYLERPAQPMYGFLQDLMAEPDVGIDEDDEYEGYWGDGWGENAFYEFYRDGLTARANGWANEKNLSTTDRDALLEWINRLPYRGDAVMLHLGY